MLRWTINIFRRDHILFVSRHPVAFPICANCCGNDLTVIPSPLALLGTTELSVTADNSANVCRSMPIGHLKSRWEASTGLAEGILQAAESFRKLFLQSPP